MGSPLRMLRKTFTIFFEVTVSAAGSFFACFCSREVIYHLWGPQKVSICCYFLYYNNSLFNANEMLMKQLEILVGLQLFWNLNMKFYTTSHLPELLAIANNIIPKMTYFILMVELDAQFRRCNRTMNDCNSPGVCLFLDVIILHTFGLKGNENALITYQISHTLS